MPFFIVFIGNTFIKIMTMKYIATALLLSVFTLSSCFEKPVENNVENTETIIEENNESQEVLVEDENSNQWEDLSTIESNTWSEDNSITDVDISVEAWQENEIPNAETNTGSEDAKEEISEEYLDETSKELEELFKDIWILGDDAE